MMSLPANHYNFHGLRIAVTGEPSISEAINSSLWRFATDREDNIDLQFESVFVSEPGKHQVERPEGKGRPIYEPIMGEVLYFDETDQVFISYSDRVRALYIASRGHIKVSITRAQADNPWLVSHSIFTIQFIEFLKRNKLYGLHAAGLYAEGKGLLLAGNSGAGKSTLTLSLLKAGFDFLGDDMVFLSRKEDGLRVLAFPDETNVTDETVSFFPEINYLLDRPRTPGQPKRRISAEQIYGAQVVWECEPAAVVFPKVCDREKSVLKPVAADEAFLELAPNVLLTEADSTQLHLDILARLVGKADFYRLEAGRDFEAIPTLLRGLLG